MKSPSYLSPVAGLSLLSIGLLIFAVFVPLLPGQEKQPPVPKPTDAPSNTVAPPKTDGVGASVDPKTYLIGTEDVIRVDTWREPDFSRTIAVRPDGKISMPLLGEIPASGLTPLQLTDDLQGRIGKYVNKPEVSVTVLEVRSKKYYVDGETNRPGAYPLVTPTRVLEAISIAGGFREFANQKDIRILRGGDKILKFNYRDVIKGKHLEQNVFLENNDHIIVR